MFWLLLITEHFTDLDNLNFVIVVWFWAQIIATAASNYDAWYKSGQKWLKSN